jgi:hypothetical protein
MHNRSRDFSHRVPLPPAGSSVAGMQDLECGIGGAEHRWNDGYRQPWPTALSPFLILRRPHQKQRLSPFERDLELSAA